MNWDDPEARLHLLEAVGAKEYNRQFEEHRKASVVATVNGIDIRPVGSRFGRIFMLEGKDVGYSTLEAATAAAKEFK